MKLTSILAVASLSLAALTQPAMAQTMDHGKMGMTQDLPMVDAEVRRVDKENGKVTLKHGTIKNLDMPPMTMVFRARDKAMLEGIAVGDKVQFTLHPAGMASTVTSIKPVQ